MTASVPKTWKGWFFAITALLALAILYLGYRYRGHVHSAFGWISEETGGTTMAVLTIALALCALAYGLFCFILPFIVYFSLKDLRQRTARLEDALQKSTPIRVRTADALPGTPHDGTRAR